ncbi:FG-GAP-like repeat-containing protein [Seonamhaeicola sp.]|uniref:VCBS repeat-containing protein n=1 Tax=Seonamhaeicola sp. TaxID=1912245 RepID=UPI002629F37F|nr:FG-GAP-like repeat-containing protein [Seonamhaeicola sp.]
MKKFTYILFAVLVGILNCSKSKSKIEVSKSMENKTFKRFTILAPGKTGISFVNPIKESIQMNGLTYEYLYNGGGVAVGDVNNDGLVDIFFVSSLKGNELYLNTGGLQFKNITQISAVKGQYGFSTGATMVDINYDGKLDIYVCKSGRFNDPNKRKNELYINQGLNNQGIPVFSEEASKYQLDLPHNSTQAAFFDYDKDGDLDMFLLNHGIDPLYSTNIKQIPKLLNEASQNQSEQLYRNDGGKFTNVSKLCGITNNALSFGLGIAIGDVNNDGWPDILTGHDYSEKDHMYLNQKNGTFKEVSHQAIRHMSNFSMGNDIADFNNDGLLDFISVDMVSESSYEIKTSMSGMNPAEFYQLVDYGLHHQYMFNTLQMNNGISENHVPLFSDIAQLAGVSNTDWSWGPLLFDMDNDGYKDLFVSNGIKRDFRNNDFRIYKEKRTKQHLKELKQTNNPKLLFETYVKDLIERIPTRKKSNLFYTNNGDLTFTKQNTDWGLDVLTSSTGAAYADLDNDGDLDVVTNNVDDFAFIYRNNTLQTSDGNNYLQIQLKGSDKNPDGVGARVQIKCGKQQQVIEQNLTRGFQSSISRKLHFGLGENTVVDTLTIVWPDGKEQKLVNLKSNTTYALHYKDAERKGEAINSVKPIFKDITKARKITYRHKENTFNDFKREILLPHRMSQFGPAVATGDVNNDGLDDFYVGGALGFSGALFVQEEDGTFAKSSTNKTLWHEEKMYEDIDALFFDADLDGDQDLFVVSGGNEYNNGALGLEDRLYINNGNGLFTKARSLPKVRTSGGVVKVADYDNDGDLDVFVGGRQTPCKYPYPSSSVIYRNDSHNGEIKFENVTNKIAPDLEALGMVTDVNWVDVDGDSDLDIVAVGEWMAITVFENNAGTYALKKETGLEKHVGWWNSISSADFDGDGDMDFIAGNLGLNYKYKATAQEPFEIYAKDFDDSGSLDIVLGYYDSGSLVPLRGRECSSNQMPFVKEKFKSYDLFGKATLTDVYGQENLEEALHYQATNFATSYIENLGDGTFNIRPLENKAQLSSINTIQIDDYNQDSFLDILIAGNLYGAEVETPRNDASYGLLLTGDGSGNFKAVEMFKSAICISGDVKRSALLKLTDNKQGILFAKNQGNLQLLTLE